MLLMIMLQTVELPTTIHHQHPDPERQHGDGAEGHLAPGAPLQAGAAQHHGQPLHPAGGGDREAVRLQALRHQLVSGSTGA